jgi:ATP-dependent DNA helicase PIF1
MISRGTKQKMSTEEQLKSPQIGELKLNPKQTTAFNYMVQGKNIFLTGPGGTGKSALIKLFKKLYNHSKLIAMTSTTGTSALLLNGTTLHSYLGIGMGTDSIEKIVDKITKWKWLNDRWCNLQCLIIDEISMLDPDLFDKLEHIARIIRKNSIVFGGIQLILSGDFLQLPCVGTEKFCFQAQCWDLCIDNTIYLTEIIRQGDSKFQNCLNNVRIGNLTPEVYEILESCKGKILNNNFGIIPTKLYSTNYDVDRVNNIELDNLSKDGRQFYQYDMEIKPQGNTKLNMTDKYKKYCNAPEEIQLCLGAQVILLKNLDLGNGLANGSRGVIIDFVDDFPLVKFLNGMEILITPHVWEIKENDKIVMYIQQIPLKVAYAISIHRGQGCSLDYVQVDLSNIFEYGQAYVALSRVKNLSGLSIIDIVYERIRAHPIAVQYYENLT